MLARNMTIAILAYAIICILIVLIILVSASFASSMAEFFGSENGIVFSAALAFLMGAAFLLAAPASKFPLFFKVIGWFAIIESPILLFIPNDVISAYIDFFLVENLFVYRIIGVPVTIAILVFVIVAALPERKNSDIKISDNET